MGSDAVSSRARGSFQEKEDAVFAGRPKRTRKPLQEVDRNGRGSVEPRASRSQPQRSVPHVHCSSSNMRAIVHCLGDKSISCYVRPAAATLAGLEVFVGLDESQ